MLSTVNCSLSVANMLSAGLVTPIRCLCCTDYVCSSMLLAKQLWLKWAAAVLALCDHSPPTFSIIASRWRGMLWAVTATQTTQPLSVRTLLHSIWKSYLAFSLIPFNIVLGANVIITKGHMLDNARRWSLLVECDMMILDCDQS